MVRAAGNIVLSKALGFVKLIRDEVITVGGKSKVTEGVTT